LELVLIVSNSKLYDDVVPKTTRNFRELATGQNGYVCHPTPLLLNRDNYEIDADNRVGI